MPRLRADPASEPPMPVSPTTTPGAEADPPGGHGRPSRPVRRSRRRGASRRGRGGLLAGDVHKGGYGDDGAPAAERAERETDEEPERREQRSRGSPGSAA